MPRSATRIWKHSPYGAEATFAAVRVRVVYDNIIDDDRRENAFGLMVSLNMLIETSGGFDYTGEDCQAWMREVGFSKTWVESLVGPDSMVIGLK